MLNNNIDIARQIPIFTESEDFEEFVTHYMWVIADKSISIKKKEDEVYNQLSKIFTGLAEANEASVDTQVRVKLALFNHEIEVFNDTHLEPQQLSDTFSREDFRCSGNTSAGAVFRYIDNELTRSSPAVKNLRKNTPGFTFVIITDAQVNDNESVRAEARRLLEANRFYKNYARVLVVFLGREQDMATAVAMANGEAKNVVALDDDLVSLLGPVIINSTVTFADGTHINGNDNQDLSDMAKDAKKRDKDGTASADDLSDQDLHDKLLELLGK